MSDDKRSECDCVYCKDMKEIQEFHDNGGCHTDHHERTSSYIRDE